MPYRSERVTGTTHRTIGVCSPKGRRQYGKYELKLDKLAQQKLWREEPELTTDRDQERDIEQIQANQAQEARRAAEKAAHRQGHGLRIG